MLKFWSSKNTAPSQPTNGQPAATSPISSVPAPTGSPKELEVTPVSGDVPQSKSAEELAAALRRLADFFSGEWNLTSRLELGSTDAAARQAENQLNRFLAAVRESTTYLQDTLIKAATGAARNSLLIRSMAEKVDEIHKNIDLASQAVEQGRSGVESVAQSANDSAALAHKVDQVTDEGNQVVSQAISTIHGAERVISEVVEKINALAERSQQIAKVSEVIDRIADQTNLLALNAAIEAARAGVHGRGFSVVADEVRKLAESTGRQTREIHGLIAGITRDLEAARQAIDQGARQVRLGVNQVESAGQALERIHSLVKESSGHTAQIAAAVEEQSAALAGITDNVQSVVTSTGEVSGHAAKVAQATFALAHLTEEGQMQLAKFRTGSYVDRVLGWSRDLAVEFRTLLEESIDSGRVSLDQVLELKYEEIKGPAIKSLSRLFDVSKVSYEGFQPPKFHTAYDSLIDLPLQKILDRYLAKDPRLTSALIVDLNAYAPSHLSKFCQDCTGDVAGDRAINRIKRFFHDNGIVLRGARYGIGVEISGNVVTRQDLKRLGCRLDEPPPGDPRRDIFLMEPWAWDSGEVSILLMVPVYIKGHRFGAAIMAWNPEK